MAIGGVSFRVLIELIGVALILALLVVLWFTLRVRYAPSLDAELLGVEAVGCLDGRVEEPGFFLRDHNAVGPGSWAEDDAPVRKVVKWGMEMPFATSLAMAVRAEIGLPTCRAANRDMVVRVLNKMCKELNVRNSDAVHIVAIATELVFTPTSTDVRMAEMRVVTALASRRKAHRRKYAYHRGVAWRIMCALGFVEPDCRGEWSE